jgi:hypothetical protein
VADKLTGILTYVAAEEKRLAEFYDDNEYSSPSGTETS